MRGKTNEPLGYMFGYTLPNRPATRTQITDISAGQNGGDEETRTPNPRLAKAVLCQLSYVPQRPER